MADNKILPYLIRLLDDDSAVVQEAVRKELCSFGSALENEIGRLGLALNEKQKEALDIVLKESRKEWLKSSWLKAFDQPSDPAKLEDAFTLLSKYQNPDIDASALSKLLDALADEYASSRVKRDAFTLANFLFKSKELKGAKKDYYNPRNSDLVYTIERKRGLPISLACVYMLVGRRLGLEIEGCNFPGHFLARVRSGKKNVLIDCFNGGELIDESALIKLNADMPEEIEEILNVSADAETIMCRVLNNLVNAYEQQKNLEDAALMAELLEAIDPEPPTG